eukprot:s2366_g10.t1
MRQLGSLAVPKRRASRAQGEAKQMEAITGPGPGKAISAAASQAGSDVNTSAGGTSRQSANVERRIAWLEEDVAVLHRRVKAECSDLGGVAGDSGLRALVARLDGELAQERRMRELLEARMVTVEENLQSERKDREASISQLSSDLNTTMKGSQRLPVVQLFDGRIDEGLSQGAAAMRERTDQTKVRLHSLIKRVDEGLTAGAAALQDSLNTKDGTQPHQHPVAIWWLPRQPAHATPAAAGSAPDATNSTWYGPEARKHYESTFAADEPGAFCASLSGADTVFCISRLNAGARKRSGRRLYSGARRPWDDLGRLSKGSGANPSSRHTKPAASLGRI